MSKRPISVCSFGSVSAGGSPTATELHCVLLGEAVGSRVVGRIRHLRESLVPGGHRFGELALDLLQLLLDAAQLLELLRGWFALDLRPRAELVDLWHELTPALVGGQPRVERLGGALARESTPVLVRRGTGGAGVDHATESR